jgi:dipeptidyl aminopeptidase/acylaminoacyl peptidase
MKPRTVWVAMAFAASAAAGPARAVDKRPQVSEQISPVKVITAKARDGHVTSAVVRYPTSKGKLPAVVISHGGLKEWTVDQLKKGATEQPVPLFYLAAGYVTVVTTWRNRNEDPQAPGALWDFVAMTEEVKKLPQVDPKSVVAWGGSGGGSMTLELAGETDLAAAAAWEPATLLFSGMMSKNVGPDEDPKTKPIMDNPAKYFTDRHRQFTREKLAKIRCPVIVTHGDVSGLKRLNFEFFFPELLGAGKNVTISIHPGMEHGLSWYSAEGRMAKLLSTFKEEEAFFLRYLATKPVPLDRSQVQWVPDPPGNGVRDLVRD